MSINMLRHNIEILQEVSDNYYKFLELKNRGNKDAEKQLINLKNQILFLQTAVKKLIEQEKNG